MAEAASEYVPVRRDVLANLQASAAAGAATLREYGNRAREAVVTEAKAFPSTARSLVQPIGVGAVLAYIATLDEVKNSETVKKQWWLLPAALLAIGYILRRKNSPHASAVVSAGAVLFVQAYRNRPKEEPQAQAPAKPAGGDTAGVPQALPVMHPIDDRTAWIQSGGQWVRVQLAAPVRPALPQQTAPAAAALVAQDPAAALAAAAFAA
ncbi:hypothetical protein [Polyangium jinanense]|uniref:Uncharacterized protein n=1 Tax=Polyangium jinanense TaxID=2829994 RepID=A0A9X3XEF9_9BACT|nr:hypothetical protein [Polyangium jinanense]MDC3988677.1 hypothetical protein [Polyangium jinanense]